MNTTSSRPPFRGSSMRNRAPAQPDTHRINEFITAREVRVIAEDGTQLGVLPIAQAQMEADKAELDLVEVAPEAKPPVCRLMDYGKFKYKEQKKEAEARKRRTENVVKELRIRYRTDVGDLEIKLRHAREFLAEGDKVKFSMRFKGREIMYTNLGVEKLNVITQRLADVATIDEQSPPHGRQIYVVYAPIKEKAAKTAAPKAAQAPTGEK